MTDALALMTMFDGARALLSPRPYETVDTSREQSSHKL
jgi:hypothetical protein